MTPDGTTAFQCLTTASNATSAATLMTTFVPNALCNTTCFGSGSTWPICGTTGYAFLFSIMSFNASTGGYSGPGGASPGEQELICSRLAACC